MRVGLARRGRPYVLMVTNMWPHDRNRAYGIFVLRQIESLRKLGLNCEVVFVDGYRSHWAYVRAALRLLYLNLARRRPVLVHGHGGEIAPVVRLFFRGPVIVSYCGSDLLGGPRSDGSLTRSSWIRRLVLRRYARLMDATITKSAAMASVLDAQTRQRNTVLPNGVDRSTFCPQPKMAARAELGWSDDERVVLFAANPSVVRKRYWLAAEGCRLAEQRIGPIRLEVAWGTPPHEMPRLMAACDCLLLTSAIEGSPNVVKEAVTCALPVISSDVGDVREILAEVHPSWVCPPQPRAFAQAVVDCLRAGDRSDGWEKSAWLSERKIAARLIDLYASHTDDVAGARG